MFLFAHVGLTTVAAATIDRISGGRSTRSEAQKGWGYFRGRAVDFRLVALGSMLPDIIDKPLGIYILPQTLGNGRVYAHTLMFLLATILLAGLFYRRRKSIAIPAVALGTTCHLIFDAMWNEPRTLFWPLLGAMEKGDPSGWLTENWHGLLTRPDCYVPEIVGLVFVLFFAAVMLRRQQSGKFMRNGWFLF